MFDRCQRPIALAPPPRAPHERPPGKMPPGSDALLQLSLAGATSRDAPGADSASPGGALTGEVLTSALRDSPGKPLPLGVRLDMETRLGGELDRVRLHDDARAGTLARAAGAKAFSFGDHVVLSDRAAAGTERHELLAHELVHHLQQREYGLSPSGAGPLRASRAGDPAEIEAVETAREAVSGGARDESASSRGRGGPSRGRGAAWATRAQPASGALSLAPDPDLKDAVKGYKTATLLDLDSAEKLAAVLDRVLDLSPTLQKYLHPAVAGKAGDPTRRAMAGHLDIVDTAEFSSRFYKEKGEPEPTAKREQEKIKEVKGFTQAAKPHDIYLQGGLVDFGDALHEAIHRVSLPGFRPVSNAANEGATEYFTRVVLAEAGLALSSNFYDRHVAVIRELVKLVGEEPVGKAFFRGDLKGLLSAMGTTPDGTSRYLAWQKVMMAADKESDRTARDEKLADAAALLTRFRLMDQLEKRIDEAKKQGK